MVEFDDYEIDKQDHPIVPPPKKSAPVIKNVLSVLIVLLVVIVGYFGYGYITGIQSKTVDKKNEVNLPRVLQLDILNGCGAHGVGSKFTDYLRSKGFDVVENKNYKSFQVPQTLVVDRVGDLTAARRVAEALGVKEKNIVQQINPDYFVDVSVIIGKDYTELHPVH